MQDLLKDHLVEHVQKEGRCFSLTCTICGTAWRSTTATDKSSGRNIGTELTEEVLKHNRMCTFCGRPVCLNCFEDIERTSLCGQCGQRLRQRLEEK